MKEKERLKIIKQIAEEKNRMSLLKEEFNRLKNLEESEIVREYIELKEKLENIEIIENEKIIKKIFDQQYHNPSCNHDIYFYIGGYVIERDFTPESEYRYYREINQNKEQ